MREAGPALREAGLEALLVLAESSRDPDLAPFVGEIHLGRSLLLCTAAGEVALGFWTAMEREEAARSGLPLLSPEDLGVAALHRRGATAVEQWGTAIGETLQRLGASGGRIALAGRVRLGDALEAVEAVGEEGAGRWVSGHELVRRLRKEKTEAELLEARQAARGLGAALRRVAAVLASATVRGGELRSAAGEPLRAHGLRAEISRCLADHGLHEPEGNIVAAGPEAGVPHTRGSDERLLRAGEALVVDLFPRRGLFADCTRTFCVGQPPEALHRAHGAVAAALEEAHRSARPGAVGWDLQRATCRRLERAGYPTPLSDPGTERGYVHGLGHGVGYELHEYPSFRRDAGSAGVLETGDLLTLEPGLYDPAAGYGVRLEDLVHLGPDGPENLTPLPYALDPGDWG